MPQRRGLTGAPRDYIAGGEWPHAEIVGPIAVEYAQHVAARLTAAIDGRSIRQVAEAADLRHATVLSVLHGRSWPDLVTLAKLEQTLGVRLWPELI